MHNGNPHAPTTSWLESIAGGAATIEADAGDEGTDIFTRDDGTYEVTVTKHPPDTPAEEIRDDDGRDYPPGIYLLNATGELHALATEDGGGDRQLLWEVIGDEVDPDVHVVVNDRSGTVKVVAVDEDFAREEWKRRGGTMTTTSLTTAHYNLDGDTEGGE